MVVKRFVVFCRLRSWLTGARLVVMSQLPPPHAIEPHKTTISIAIPPALKEWVIAEAERRNMSASALVVYVLEKARKS